ncbi:MAG: MBL fold metallo-hydrolase [Candidatus Auribacterota bacterium]|nr:MBL fold metallo-hydrolase [Candidatus Auribacterota bacterium]
MKISITILVDDTVTRSMLLAEHGFSAYLDINGHKVLFDAGQGMALKHNARLMGIKLNNLDSIIISHGHYDHANGIKKLINLHKIMVYAHPLTTCPRYKKIGDNEFKQIGIDWISNRSTQEMIEWQLSSDPQYITNDVVLSGEIPRTMKFEESDEPFYIKDRDNIVKDYLFDDQALFLRTPEGLIIITGCAHSGLINTILHAVKLMNDDRVLAVIGGTHLIHSGEERLQVTVEHLESLKVKKLYAAHCTGFNSCCFLKERLKDRFERLEVGKSLEWIYDEK